jgi:CHAT domain-containing protein
LADEVALATLPSPAAFVAARRHARATRERDTLLAFADPALAGTEDVRTLTQWTNLRNGIRAPTAGARNAASVCRLRPLPETRREALALAERLGSRPGDVLLGRAASERALSELDASGALARRRIVLFATHGLVAGELSGVGEPALVLTPPEGCAATSEEDDGLLTASEIAMLTFDADWVILSGCNTAAPGRTGAAPLSGLARAFLYAGARRLLVSHWSVDSEAAADLTAALFDPRNKDLTPAAALQRAMRSVRDSRGANDYRAHPAFWAPFVLVGDGR